jgi:hypothetical protein
MQYNLSIAGKDYRKLQKHLFPGDNKEAVAIALCGRFSSKEQTKLLVHEVIPIPHDKCMIREDNLLSWPTSYILEYIEKANKRGFSILKIHCHPGGGKYFSEQDDRSDGDLFPSLFGWIDDAEIHSSCIMLPSGEIFGRVFKEDNTKEDLNKVTVIGNVIQVWENDRNSSSSEEFDLRNIQAFGEGTVSHLKNMSITVVGCSGTGSIVIEQLVRLGVGRLLIIDPDIVEEKNLNRILNSTIADAENKLSKVEMTKQAIDRIGLGTEVITIDKDIYSDINIVRKIANTDVVIGCVDSVDARHLMNQISSFYLLPYFDVGVSLKADGKGGVEHICGTANYIQPGGSSLLSRGLYTDEDLRSALTAKFNPEDYEERKKEKYIKDVQVDSPAVISINMMASAMVVNEFLSKIHGFRHEDSGGFSLVRTDILNGFMQAENDGEPDLYLQKYYGRGDNIAVPLNMHEFENQFEPIKSENYE